MIHATFLSAGALIALLAAFHIGFRCGIRKSADWEVRRTPDHGKVWQSAIDYADQRKQKALSK